MTSLDSAIAKLSRAEQHIKAAQEIITSFIESKFYTVGRKQDDKGQVDIFVENVKPIPTQFALLIGDAAFNLRAALDHIAFASCKPKTVAEEKRVQFPLVLKSSEFKHTASNRLPGIDPAALALIERVQPYHRRKLPGAGHLGVLHAVNNWDKHRGMLFAFVGIASSKHIVTIEGADTKVADYKVFRGRMKRGALLGRLVLARAKEGAKMDVKIHMTASPVFSNGMGKGFRGAFAIDTIGGARDFVKDYVIPEFQKLL